MDPRANNLHGRPKGVKNKPFASEYRNSLLKEVRANKSALAKALVGKALKGDVYAHKEINERVLGKAIQGVDLTTNGKDLPTPILHVLSK